MLSELHTHTHTQSACFKCVSAIVLSPAAMIMTVDQWVMSPVKQHTAMCQWVYADLFGCAGCGRSLVTRLSVSVCLCHINYHLHPVDELFVASLFCTVAFTSFQHVSWSSTQHRVAKSWGSIQNLMHERRFNLELWLTVIFSINLLIISTEPKVKSLCCLFYLAIIQAYLFYTRRRLWEVELKNNFY